MAEHASTRRRRPALRRAAADADRIDPRRLVAFLAMVFGMFMAILDIQIVSASLDRDPGRPRRLRQRDHLGADRLPDRRGGR